MTFPRLSNVVSDSKSGDPLSISGKGSPLTSLGLVVVFGLFALVAGVVAGVVVAFRGVML